MKKGYQKPDVTEIELVTREVMTTATDIIDGDMGVESNTLFD